MNKPSPHLVPDPGYGAHDRGKSLFVTANDGLRIHVREYGTRSSPGLSVVCLPGLARTAADFDELAPALAAGPPERHVIAIDLRGRGHSEHDADHSNYNCTVELADIVSVLIALGVGPADVRGKFARRRSHHDACAPCIRRRSPASFCTTSVR